MEGGGGGEPTLSLLLLLLLATNTRSSMPNMGPLAAAAANSVTKTSFPPSPLPSRQFRIRGKYRQDTHRTGWQLKFCTP